MNLRPLGYEPSELPDCSTPHDEASGQAVSSTSRPSPARRPSPSAMALSQVSLFGGEPRGERARLGWGTGRGRAGHAGGTHRLDGPRLPGTGGARTTTLPFHERHCRSCAGKRAGVSSTRSIRRYQASFGGGRVTSDYFATDAKRSRCSVGWPASPRRRPCGSGWISARDRRRATGTERTTRASWARTWTIGNSRNPRAHRSASS